LPNATRKERRMASNSEEISDNLNEIRKALQGITVELKKMSAIMRFNARMTEREEIILDGKERA
jgi:hypothetical protein